MVAVLIEEPPEFEFRNGLFYIVDDAGARALRPHIFLHSFRRAARAIQDGRGIGPSLCG